MESVMPLKCYLITKKKISFCISSTNPSVAPNKFDGVFLDLTSVYLIVWGLKWYSMIPLIYLQSSFFVASFHHLSDASLVFSADVWVTVTCTNKNKKELKVHRLLQTWEMEH